LDDLSKIFLGVGVVQNGSFGEYHSVIIDNLYIGILMTGGLISLGMFLFVIFFVFYTVRKIERNQKIWIISSLLGILSAGVFENVMHLLYLGFIPVFFKISKWTTVR
jgi:O-antigen ligase